jgi:ubiquinone/menaquinone biosynthesis C-methylase UbiE
MREPHFIRDYRRVVSNLVVTHPLDDAMALAVGGGDYEAMGKLECELLAQTGLRTGHVVIDIGCGSGRLSTQLSKRYGTGIDYLGIDLIPELLVYARSRAIPAYRFEVTNGLSIPCHSVSADFVVAFSVFTHLKHRETRQYLREAQRVLRPGGVLLFSFIEFWQDAKILAYTLAFTLLGQRKVQNHFLSQRVIKRWSTEMGFEIEIIGPRPLGQTIAVLRRI